MARQGSCDRYFGILGGHSASPLSRARYRLTDALESEAAAILANGPEKRNLPPLAVQGAVKPGRLKLVILKPVSRIFEVNEWNLTQG